MTDESDEEIGKRILERFPRAFTLGPQDKLKEEFVETRGRKTTLWHALAITHAKEREAAGATRTKACEEFQKILAEKHNYHIDIGSVLEVVNSKHGRPFRYVAGKKFEAAILDNDLDEAIKWFKHLSPKERKRWGFE